ncbi:MAG: F0F1 ATP synthase subunit delta [Geobacteraceae bacterium]|nr:F0F1 ATP synthase subunit delta [Geobacteraceae bacterium]
MKFDIGTFVFQVINFIVLLFILKRLLYRPVREMLQKRRDLVEETIRSAEDARREALQLKEQHRQEIEQLHGLQEQMLQKMKEDAFAERKRLLAGAEQEAALLIEKEKALFDSEKGRSELELKESAVEAAALFSARMLGEIADEEVHRAIWRKFLAQLEQIADHLVEKNLRKEPVEVELLTAFVMPGETLEELRTAMEAHLSRRVTLHASTNRELIAGVVLKACDLVYDFSLAGQVADLKRRLHEVV